jgi:hypothetical protein
LKPETFETELSAEEMYAILPHFWHPMPPDKKKAVAAVAEKHDDQCCVACIK